MPPLNDHKSPTSIVRAAPSPSPSRAAQTVASTEDARARELAEDIAALLRAGLITVVAAADDASQEAVRLAPVCTATDVDQWLGGQHAA